MEFDEKTIGPIIEAKYSDLTQLEKGIADYFLNNTKIVDFTIEELAKQLYVSKAAVSRFVKKCGFKGYREFIFQYNRSQAHTPEGIVDSTHTVLNTYNNLLKRVYSLMDERQIIRVSNLISSMQRVIVCGGGSSGLVASEMESRFMRIGIDIDSLTDSDRIRMQAVFCNSDSLVIGISISGGNESIMYLLKEAHRRMAKTVLITSRDSLYFQEFCDEVILISTISNLDSGSSISPQFPILIMIDVIYNEYMRLNRREKLAMHGDTLRALESKEHHILDPEE